MIYVSKDIQFGQSCKAAKNLKIKHTQLKCNMEIYKQVF